MKKENQKNLINKSNITVGGDFYLGDQINVEKIKDDKVPQASTTNKPTLKNLVAKHQIKKALELLLVKKDLDLDLENEIISQSNRWNRVQREIRQGTVSEADKGIILNRLTNSLLEIIDELP